MHIQPSLGGSLLGTANKVACTIEAHQSADAFRLIFYLFNFQVSWKPVEDDWDSLF